RVMSAVLRPLQVRVHRRTALVCFFFARRRRHTRFSRDWSSDVCSSDLRPGGPGSRARRANSGTTRLTTAFPLIGQRGYHCPSWEIGRASCRERVETPVLPVAYQKTKRLRPCAVAAVRPSD